MNIMLIFSKENLVKFVIIAHMAGAVLCALERKSFMEKVILIMTLSKI